MKTKKWSFWLRLAGTSLSLGLLAALLWRLNWSEALAYLQGFSPAGILLTLGLYLASQALNTLRWCTLLWGHEVKISFWQAFRITWSGIFASNFLPSTIGGDGLRLAAILPHTGGNVSVAVGSVALDRLTNMAAMACFLPAPLLTFGEALPGLLSLTLPGSLGKVFPSVGKALQEWANRPAALGWALLAAFPSNLVFMLAAFTVARQLGMEVSFWQVMAVQTVTYFLSVLPISINGLGVREVTYTTLFAALGVSLEQASALAVLTRFFILLITLPGALWVGSLGSPAGQKAQDA
jgi:uncharacterized membrane protein YbhN (UPF0104 family)